MSNSKRYSEGNKGSDLSYRGKVLKGLQKVSDNTAKIKGAVATVENVGSLDITGATGTTDSSYKSVTFINVAGTIRIQGSNPLPAGTYSFNNPEGTLAPISYVCTGSTDCTLFYQK